MSVRGIERRMPPKKQGHGSNGPIAAASGASPWAKNGRGTNWQSYAERCYVMIWPCLAF